MTMFRSLAFLGYPDYKVGDDGFVRSRINNRWGSGQWRILKGAKSKNGYLCVTLRNGKTKYRDLVHRIVLLAFVGPCPPGQETRHFPDSDRTNNRLSNLQWGTRDEQTVDRIVHGTHVQGDRSPHALFSDSDIPIIHRMYRSGMSCGQIGRKFNVKAGVIHLIVTGQTYKWAQPPKKTKIRPNAKLKGLGPSIREAHAAGETQTSIARRLGVTQAAVWYHLNK